jgi:hypothetical protein
MVKKSFIICEGGDDKGFLNKFSKYLDITNVQIKSMGGKSNLLNKDGYTIIKKQVDAGLYNKILFVFDADFIKDDAKCGGYENSEKCIKDLIESLEFTNIAKYYIMCNPDTTNGNLEHLVLSTIEYKKTICITTFLKCINSMETHDNKKIVLSSYKTIFKESPYNLNHENFDKLKDLLDWTVEKR